MSNLELVFNDNSFKIEPEDFNVFRIYNSNDFLRIESPEMKYYLEPLIRNESIILITGPAGCGKTMFTMGLCKSLVSGKSFGNWNVKNKCNVLYIDGELPIYLMKKRIHLISMYENEFYILSSAVGRKNYNLSDQSFRDYIFDQLKEKDIQVCVFDNLSSLSNGIDENSKREYDPINKFFLHLRRNGITSIIVHHTGKSNKNEQRGTSARTDNIDICCNIHSPIKNDKLYVNLEFRKWRFERSELLKYDSFVFDNGEWILSNDNSDKISDQYISILEMISMKMSQTEIAKKLNCTQPNVAKICKKMREDGLLDMKNHITDEGMKYITEKTVVS